MPSLRLIIFSSLFIYVHSSSHENGSNSPYILESESRPEDLNFMPTLGNGQLGFTIFGDAIFVNGIYNGKGGLSHRARIPNVANISVIPIGSAGYTKESFKMDLYNGIFERKQSNSEIETTIRTYPHRFFNRAIINEVFVQRRSNASGSPRELKFLIDTFPGSQSDDIIPVSVTTQTDGKSVVSCFQTKDMENADFQSNKTLLCLATNTWPKHFELTANETTMSMRIVVAIGETSVIAAKELYDVLAVSADSLFKSHSEQWNEFWHQFHIDLEGNLDLSRTINAGIFYLASSLPSLVTNQKQSPFYGLSPTGLGRGNLDNDYQGHNFWDTEIWMLPVVTQLSTDWTRQLLSYRFNKLAAAVDNALKHGNAGARFPWESALTGTEVTNPCCPEVAEQQFHITADIAFAAKHYFAVTNNTRWMKSEGCELSQRIAEFWVSRVSLDKKTGQFDIKYVMGPDEDHENVTNNGYTNLAAHHSLEFVHLTQALCGTDTVFAAKCLDIAEKIKVPYDAKLDYHPQYEGYTPDVQIKQADAVLLSYPMLYPMNVSTLSNNLKIYEKVTRESGPAMTWSMHAIGHLDEGNQQKARELFEKGYKNYVREPFEVWSEVIKGKEGGVNFITGVGGFMQAVINGYGGVRFHSDRMEVKKPHILPGTRAAVISGIKYQGSLFSVKLSSEPSIVVDYIKPYQTLRLVDDQDNIRLMIEGIDCEWRDETHFATKSYLITHTDPIKKTIFVKATMNN